MDASAFAAGDDLFIAARFTTTSLEVSLGEATATTARASGASAATGAIELGAAQATLHADGALGQARVFGAPSP